MRSNYVGEIIFHEASCHRNELERMRSIYFEETIFPETDTTSKCVVLADTV